MANLIANPVINSPFEEPRRYFRFIDDGITDKIVPEWWRGTYFTLLVHP